MRLYLPLTSGNLQIIKAYIRDICVTFSTYEIPYNGIDIENAILSKANSQRILITHMSLPVRQALDYLQEQGSINIGEQIIRIIRPEDLDLPGFSTSIPLTFSIGEKVKKESQAMTELYVELFDIENRLRNFIESILQSKYGEKWFEDSNIVLNSVRVEINHERSKLHVHVDETRIKYLQFSTFKHLYNLLTKNWDTVFKNYFQHSPYNLDVLKTELGYIHDSRTFIAHCNFLIQSDRHTFRDKVHALRKVLQSHDF